jgi:hypothetical protein
MVQNKQQSIPSRRKRGSGGGSGGLEFFSFLPLCPEQLCGVPFFCPVQTEGAFPI